MESLTLIQSLNFDAKSGSLEQDDHFQPPPSRCVGAKK